jgi:hypothetical protein
MFTIEQSGKLFFVLFLGAIAGACVGLVWLMVLALGAVAKGVTQ